MRGGKKAHTLGRNLIPLLRADPELLGFDAAVAGPARCEPTAPVTCLFENLLIGGDDRAEAVEDQGAQFQSVLLGALVIIQGVVGEHEPPLLQLQRRHLRAVLDFLVQPPWRARGACEPRTRKRNAKYQLNHLHGAHK